MGLSVYFTVLDMFYYMCSSSSDLYISIDDCVKALLLNFLMMYNNHNKYINKGTRETNNFRIATRRLVSNFSTKKINRFNGVPYGWHLPPPVECVDVLFHVVMKTYREISKMGRMATGQ